jgi:hypothetical protein
MKQTRHVRRSEKSELRKPAKRKPRKKRLWKISPVTGLPVFIMPRNAKPITSEMIYKILRES